MLYHFPDKNKVAFTVLLYFGSRMMRFLFSEHQVSRCNAHFTA